MQNRRRIWWRARGVEQLNSRFSEPSVLRILDSRVADGRPVRVLEIGCGEAHALMALAWRYRQQNVSFVGVNDLPTNTMAGPEDLRDACIDFDICSWQNTSRLRLPKLIFTDAGNRLPFADGAFDVVLSSATFPYIINKARALMEVWRVLDFDGTALIHLDSFDPKMPDFMNTAGNPHLFTPRFVIYDKERNRVPTADYLARFGRRGFGIQLEPSAAKATNTVIRISRQSKKELDLRLILDELSTIAHMEAHLSSRQAGGEYLWWGTRSVFFIDEATSRSNLEGHRALRR